jgi:hypothetical protein
VKQGGKIGHKSGVKYSSKLEIGYNSFVTKHDSAPPNGQGQTGEGQTKAFAPLDLSPKPFHFLYTDKMALRSAAATLLRRTALAAAPQVRLLVDNLFIC